MAGRGAAWRVRSTVEELCRPVLTHPKDDPIAINNNLSLKARSAKHAPYTTPCYRATYILYHPGHTYCTGSIWVVFNFEDLPAYCTIRVLVEGLGGGKEGEEELDAL